MFSPSEENYLKAIYSLEREFADAVSTNLIAEMLSTKASSVTDMIKKLAQKKLVIYQKYKGVKLSNSGKKIALSVIRKHRLWETFLVEKLHFNWDEVHDIAEQLEHIKSPDLVNRLDEFLEFPTNDPHGDPIPDKNGNITYHQKSLLANFKHHQKCIVVGVKDSSSKFLKFLEKLNISLGVEFEIKEREEFDGTLKVLINGKTASISKKVAENLLVKTI
ncbi:MAG: metal-dependent transcriptional regulator [Chitinophagales bacterium]